MNITLLDGKDNEFEKAEYVAKTIRNEDIYHPYHFRA